MTRLRAAVGQVVRSAVHGFRTRGRPEELLPGQVGKYATTEATAIGPVTTSYNPNTDGDPDPGEIVWTWVPYVENDGRGKDRPVLIVAREPTGTLLAVQLSSQQHDEDERWVPVGSGGWDAERRESWVDMRRLLRVHPQGMRREATALARDRFDQVIANLNDHYGWF
ncbi:MAG TPA: type II toxin-antitoxin system PemK/MazF family toxin [Jiangellaceae bacterium]|nr:type II toxin-antitoxin system PemK/MazF family toxin [Jiangellaceae bacterium]